MWEFLFLINDSGRVGDERSSRSKRLPESRRAPRPPMKMFALFTSSLAAEPPLTARRSNTLLRRALIIFTSDPPAPLSRSPSPSLLSSSYAGLLRFWDVSNSAFPPLFFLRHPMIFHSLPLRLPPPHPTLDEPLYFLPPISLFSSTRFSRHVSLPLICLT